MNPSQAWFKTRRRLIGVVLLAVLGLLIALSVALYNKQFSRVTMVTLYTDSTGNQMNLDAEVMVRGVVVGEVRRITSSGTGARLELALQPGAAGRLPANVSARMLPTTLFGQRFVELVAPPRPAAQTLAHGGVIRQDRSRDAIELEKVFNDLLPMLTAVQPQKLSVTLTALATALQGRGGKLGQTLRQIDAYLKQFNPHLPALDSDIRRLAQVTRTYAQAAPDIVQQLRDFTVTSQTVAAEAGNLRSVYATVTGASQHLTTFLTRNESTIIALSVRSTGTLRILARYSAEFPCVFSELTRFIPSANKVLGAGSRQPGLHVTVHPVESLGAYGPGDAPRFGDNLGPHCYPVPFRGISLNDGASPARATTPTAAQPGGTARPGQVTVTGSMPVPAGGLGLPNSAAENELINELLAPAANVPPDRLPSWSSVLTGPLYRGTEVTVK
ncbi:MAG: MCE family protein [Nocardiopsaceae bacterium]|jgi:phospholipid/cholesterol/gamma-HCH transport system substrate-binding protein|nr:MCE family protein [Nocardiopsaceae bacterium]